MMWTVSIVGTPAPKGSMKCVGQKGRHQLVEDDKAKKGKPWRALVKAAGASLLPKVGDQLQAGPVSVDCVFVLPRPASTSVTRRAWPAVRNADVDKLARMVLDGLTDSGLIGDDSQVVELTARKAYPDTPGCPGRPDQPGVVIRIWPTLDRPVETVDLVDALINAGQQTTPPKLVAGSRDQGKTAAAFVDGMAADADQLAPTIPVLQESASTEAEVVDLVGALRASVEAARLRREQSARGDQR